MILNKKDLYTTIIILVVTASNLIKYGRMLKRCVNNKIYNLLEYLVTPILM